MAEMEMTKTLTRKSIRTNFVFLLYLCVVVVSYIPWIVFVLILTISEGLFFYDWGMVWEDLLVVVLLPLLIFFHTGLLAMALSVVLRQKWWVAILGTILFCGTPLIAFAYTWIAKQIARLFYLPTESDLQRTKIILNMKVKPRKGIVYMKQDETVVEQKNVERSPSEGIKGQSESQTDELIASSDKLEKGKLKQKLARFFTLWQCAIAALFGGIFSGGILLSLNYKHFGERRNYILGMAVSLVGQFGLLILLMGLSYSNTSILAIIPVLLAISISVFFWQKELQKEDVESAIMEHQAGTHTWWVVIGIIILSWIFAAIFNPLAEEIVWTLDIPFMY